MDTPWIRSRFRGDGRSACSSLEWRPGSGARPRVPGAHAIKSKLKFILPLVALLVLGGAYKTVLAKPPAKAPKPKVDGQLYVIPQPFLVNLADGRYVQLTVGLVLPHHEAVAPAEGHGSEPPEGWGTLPQEAVVRSLVTETLTGVSANRLVRRSGRKKLKAKLLKRIKAHTDVHAEDVLFTDVAVQ
jgi:flagellar basal body-associated protein FliL